MKGIVRTFQAPLGTAWSEQFIRLQIASLSAGAPHMLLVNGQPAVFQFTGKASEVLVRLGFARGETKTLEFVPVDRCETDLQPVAVRGDRVGIAGRELTLAAPLAGIGPFPVESRIHCDAALESRTLTRTSDGPLFTDYRLCHRFAGNRGYDLTLRCYRHEPIIEVAEEFSLGMNARWELVLNPTALFDSFLAGDSFEGESQPTIRSLTGDLLARLQMPVLGEYYVPTNHGWFALFNRRNETLGMLGFLGLYGPRWANPVANMLHVYGRDGATVLEGSLVSGRRHWLLYVGPVEKQFTPQRRLVFHRLHAGFNGLRLDEHLDLTGDALFDVNSWQQPGFFSADYRQRARRNAATLPPLSKTEHLTLRALLDPTPAAHAALADRMFARFEKWVRQFQGYRDGQPDYNKNVIGFSRTLRGLMIDYELLRKDAALTDAQVRQLNAYFVFAARRILDEGRWPHSRSWLHPDHPESTRDFYAYGGEHKPDRLVWSNCLPNFQSDPMCALLHLGALLPEHPDAARWRQFALDDLERQLNAYCSASGAWEESINYALYTLGYFVITFRALKNRWGVDYFHDGRVRRFAGWLVRCFGPFDKRFSAYTYPPIGNSQLPQQYVECLLAFASELKRDDPLRADLMSVYQKMEPVLTPVEHFPLLLAVANVPDRAYPLRPLTSEHMQELGVAMRHNHPSPTESYLFQKIGFWKDHYENDETAINWYAKGTPLVMEYGTYTGDAATAAAHNLVEVPDMDSLRRGYMADSFFTPTVDYSRCEVPVTLKLQYGYIRSWAEIDGPPKPPKFFYLCDENPVGPKTWKVRQLLFVKPDYVLLFDRVFGAVPHRYNLHSPAEAIQRDGAIIRARGMFDLDLLCYVQHPRSFEFQDGELVPGNGTRLEQRQRFFRLYNTTDDSYRTVLFAQERGRNVTVESFGQTGVKVTTPEYTDYAFASDQVVEETVGDIRFVGRVGWIRREQSGNILACVPDGNVLAAFGKRIEGRGPWSYNMDGKQTIESKGVPRRIIVR